MGVACYVMSRVSLCARLLAVAMHRDENYGTQIGFSGERMLQSKYTL